ncbi:hypothetical protein EXE58_04550 [Nocardioides seonyuensis]|uniref:Uncharacterized protein n=1 Tax=Nocardioides seonyuensis TaxID=2518371 RepID=A0A4P7IFN0_9ACTN|nr:hypothetical protein [Nocardioides seonyuensis]QBX54807.1 hypothetical protein EXE58_04550 [Nocardioides seonyuensis]
MKLRIALVSALLAGTALAGPGAQSAAPTLMQTATTGTLGTWNYAVQFGEGTPDHGVGKGFCSDVVTDNVADDYPADPNPYCSEYTDMRPGKRELKGLVFVASSSADTMVYVDTWVTRPHVERLQIKYSGGSKRILKKQTSSSVLSLYGDRGRYWFRVYDAADPNRTKSIVGQDKQCEKVRGKRRCRWVTVATERS